MTPTKTHPLQAIAESGAQPMTKVLALRTGGMDGLTGMMFAQQAIALCMEHGTAWSKLAHKLFPMNTQEREAAIKTWRQWRIDKAKARKEGTEPSPKMDDKTFTRIMNTAATRISHMSTIAKAIDAGMGIGELAQHYSINVEDVPGLSIDTIYQLALTYRKSAAGRTADPFLVKLGKFLEKAKQNLPESDLDHYNKVVEFYNNLSA